MSQFQVPRKLANTVRHLQRTLRDLHTQYRPELHYMRGPGPKWREKHLAEAVPVEADSRMRAVAKFRG